MFKHHENISCKNNDESEVKQHEEEHKRQGNKEEHIEVG